MEESTFIFFVKRPDDSNQTLNMSFILQATVLVLLLLIRDRYSFSLFKSEKCMGPLGCFNKDPPFADMPLPDDRETINTMFLLYTSENPHVPTNFSNIEGNVKDILQSHFKPDKPSKFAVSGYGFSSIKEWLLTMVHALVNHDRNSNVFLVHWDKDGPDYFAAAANTRVVGAEVALFIEDLQNITGIRLEDVHLIGHSLGAHIVGYAGKRLNGVGRITGLDPAGPLFRNLTPTARLNRGDAKFVDVIHTNAEPNIYEGYGIEESIGHFDFYPNGGSHQPGCNSTEGGILGSALTTLIDIHLFCDHRRSFELFTSSLRHPRQQLLGVPCDSYELFNSGKCGNCNRRRAGNTTCIPLGIHADRHISRIKPNESINLYSNTTDKEPYVCHKSLC